jgi:HEPN domain-containing protein
VFKRGVEHLAEPYRVVVSRLLDALLSQLYTRVDAEYALSNARKVLNLVEKLMGEVRS